eukprot:5381510-Amphidinium_carterae.1
MDPSAREQKELENDSCRAGMRDAARAVMGEERLRSIMSRVRLQLLKAMQVHSSLGKLTDVLGAQPKASPPS